MDTNERIAKIRNFAQKREEDIRDELSRKEKHLMDLLNTVRSYAPRMREMMKVAKALHDNGIQLGQKADSLEWSTDLVSNGWSHRVGFIGNCNFVTGRTEVYGFGIVGGGACGNNLFFDEDGELSNLVYDTVIPGLKGVKWDDSDIGHLERFVDGFDKFEEKFYKFVDSL